MNPLENSLKKHMTQIHFSATTSYLEHLNKDTVLTKLPFAEYYAPALKNVALGKELRLTSLLQTSAVELWQRNYELQTSNSGSEYKPRFPRKLEGHRDTQLPKLSMKSINPIACKKVARIKCFICDNFAKMKCAKCFFVGYCKIEHAEMDKTHNQICKHLHLIRNQKFMDSTCNNSIHFEAQRILLKKETMDYLLQLAMHLIYRENEFSLAHGIINLATTFCTEVFGSQSVQTITTIMLNIEVYMKHLDFLGAQREMNKVEQWLSAVAMENSFSSCLHTKAWYFKLWGQLNVQMKEYEEGIFCLAESIYYSSKKFGPYSPETAFCFFLLGMAFEQIGRTEESFHAVKHYVSLMYNYLKARFKYNTDLQSFLKVADLSDKSFTSGLTQKEDLECRSQLEYVESFIQTHQLGNAEFLAQTLLSSALLASMTKQEKYSECKIDQYFAVQWDTGYPINNYEKTKLCREILKKVATHSRKGIMVSGAVAENFARIFVNKRDSIQPSVTKMTNFKDNFVNE